MEVKSYSKRTYLSALLNNVGVDFLELGSYEDAIATLQHSLDALKAAASPALKSLDNEKRWFSLEGKILKATKKLKSIRAGSVAAIQSAHSISCFDDDSLVARFNEVRPCKIAVYAGGRGQASHPDLEVAVVLSNTGIAFFLASQSPTVKHSVAEALLNRCHKVLKLASDVVSNRFALCDDEHEERKTMRVALIVTGNLIFVNSALGRKTESQLLEQRFDRLGSAMVHAAAIPVA